MQKNVLTVVAVAGSCAVLYILYRFKIFSRKNYTETKDKAMGKSNVIQLNDTKENILYGTVMVNGSSSLELNSERLLNMNKSILQSIDKSHCDSVDHMKCLECAPEDRLISTMLIPFNFKIDDTGSDLSESINNISNLNVLEKSVPNVGLLNNSFDESDIYEIEDDSSNIQMKFVNLDVNENSSTESFNYLINECDLSFQNSNGENSSSDPFSFMNPEYINSMIDKIDPFDLSEAEKENISNSNKDSYKSLEVCIVDKTELMKHLELSNSELENTVPNIKSNESEVDERCRRISESDSNLKASDSSSKLDSYDASSMHLDLNNTETNEHSDIQNVIDNVNKSVEQHFNKQLSTCIINGDSEKSDYKMGSPAIEIPLSENNAADKACNCDKNDTLHAMTSSDIKVDIEKIQVDPSVRPKTKKSKKKEQIKSNDSFREKSYSSSVESESSDLNLSENMENIPSSEFQVLITPVDEETSCLPEQNVANKTSADIDPCLPDAVLESYDAFEQINSLEEFFLYQFEVPQSLVGRLIGKKGNFLNKIKGETLTKIVLINHDYNKNVKVCCVEGTKFQVMEALEMIRVHFPTEDFPNLNLSPINMLPSTHPVHIPLMQLEIPSGIVVEVQASHIVSPSEVWLQQPLHPTFRKLLILQEDMNKHYLDGSTAPLLSLPIPFNTACVCLLDDGQWARCSVYNHTSVTATIKLLDGGGFATVPLTSLRQIVVPNFTALDMQASKAYLYGIMPINGTWTAEGLDALMELIKGRPLVATVNQYCQDGVPLIKLYIRGEGEYIYVNEVLVEEGYARAYTAL